MQYQINENLFFMLALDWSISQKNRLEAYRFAMKMLFSIVFKIDFHKYNRIENYSPARSLIGMCSLLHPDNAASYDQCILQ